MTIADLVARQSDSRDEQTKSVEDQVALMVEDAKRNGWRVGAIHVEKSTSGTLPLARRKGLRTAVERVEQGQAQIVYCAYFDRMMREPTVKDEVVDRVEAMGGRVVSRDFGEISNKTAMQWYMGTVT